MPVRIWADGIWQDLHDAGVFREERHHSNSLYGALRRDQGRAFALCICRTDDPFVEECAEKRNITVVCSVLEIYNEKVRDLSVDSSDDLSIREDSAEGLVTCDTNWVLIRLVGCIGKGGSL